MADLYIGCQFSTLSRAACSSSLRWHFLFLLLLLLLLWTDSHCTAWSPAAAGCYGLKQGLHQKYSEILAPIEECSAWLSVKCPQLIPGHLSKHLDGTETQDWTNMLSWGLGGMHTDFLFYFNENNERLFQDRLPGFLFLALFTLG